MDKADQQLRALLRDCVEVLSGFGACVERKSSFPRPLGSIKSSDVELPFPKETIKGAIAILQQAIRFPRPRTILAEEIAPEQAQHVLSPQFSQLLEADLVLLEDFVSDAEAKADCRKWDDLQRWVDEFKKTLTPAEIAEGERKAREWTLATDLDRERPYLYGLLLRFNEGQSEATYFFSKLNPGFRPTLIPEGASQSVRGGFSACSLALSIAFAAMSSHGKLMVGSKEVTILEGALGLSYAMFIWILLRGYLKDDGVAIDTVPFHRRFAEQFVYLDDTQRNELAQKGMEIFKDMIESDHPKLKEWHDTLSKAVQIWLISATSDKRTKKQDEDMQKIFSSHLDVLYKSVV
jgi:hypothetical protein